MSRSTKKRATHHGRRIAMIAALVAGVLACVVAVAFSQRGPLATFFARRAMEAAGLHCDQLTVQLASSRLPSHLDLAPMRCTSPTGPLASVRFVTPLHVRLAGLRVRSTECDEILVDLRATHREVSLNTLGDIGHIGGLDQSGIDLALDSAQLASNPHPPFHAVHATIHRAGRPVAVLEHLRVSTTDTVRRTSASRLRAATAPFLGDGTLDARSTPDRADVNFVFGHLHIHVEGRHLEDRRPQVSFSARLEV